MNTVVAVIMTFIVAGVIGSVVTLIRLWSFSRLEKLGFVLVMYLADFALFAIIFGMIWIKG
jgi:hypothetical protein